MVTLLMVAAFLLGLLVGQKQQYNADSRQFGRDQQAVTDGYNRGKTDQARRSHTIVMPWSGIPLNSLVRTTQVNRAIIALRGKSITVCPNGQCWSSGSS